MTETLMNDAANTNQGSSSQDSTGSASTDTTNVGGTQQQATDGQTQNDGNASGNTDGGDKGTTQGAPEKYEFQTPEGKEYDSEVISTFSDVAKELNLTQDAAQKLVDKMAPVMQERQIQQIEAIRSEWAETSRSDKEFGGEALEANLGVAKKALDSFGTPELRALLNESGLGNHPELIRFMFRAGKAISEDTFVGNSSGSSKNAAPVGFNEQAHALYGNQHK